MGGFFRSLFRPSASMPREELPPAGEEAAARLARVLSTLATELWRARARLDKVPPDGRAPLRVVETALDKMAAALESLGVRVDDPTGRSWDERDPVKVLLFEPTPGLARPRIAEVVKPTLYLGESLLCPGEVVVAVPEAEPEPADAE